MSDQYSTQPDALIGRQIGNYVIEALLGRGGMGLVFRARHQLLDRLVALKLMHVSMAADPTFQARFRREARSAAALRHPHIVEVFDFDEADGFAYLVMELITGGTLRQRLRDGSAADPSWSLSRGLDLIRQATDALAYAHTLGMVHRDIKPENMLLQPNVAGGPAIMKVGDFGLARVNDTGTSVATQAGMAMGTLAYMAPEQASGREVDGRTDIYALGVVLYELCTGELPFQVKTITEAVFKHSFVAPPPPRDHRPDLAPELEAIILRCLAKQPEERFATAADLSAVLRAYGGNAADMNSLAMLVPGATTHGGTMIVAPDESAPSVYSLAGASNLPRIQVLDDGGTLLQVIAIRPGSMSIGRTATNDIQLDQASVSRHHLQVNWDGATVGVTDLGSRSGTQLNNTQLPAQTQVEWPWGQLLRVGTYWLRLDAPNTQLQPATPPGIPPVGSAARPTNEAVTPTSSLFAASGQIGLVVEPENLVIVPGQSLGVDLTITNVSTATEQLQVSVSGVPEQWVSLPSVQQVAPQTQIHSRITVLVPASADARAGEYPVEVRARSRLNPDQGGSVLARWTVRPFQRVALSLTPGRVIGRGRGSYRVAVKNEGNAPVRVALSAQDDGQLQYTINPEQLSIEPDTTETGQLVVEAPVRLIGGSQASRFELLARPGDGGEPVTATAQFVQVPTLPNWLLVLILPLAAVALWWGLGLAGRSDPGIAGDPQVQTVQVQRSATARVATQTALVLANAATAELAVTQQSTSLATAIAASPTLAGPVATIQPTTDSSAPDAEATRLAQQAAQDQVATSQAQNQAATVQAVAAQSQVVPSTTVAPSATVLAPSPTTLATSTSTPTSTATSTATGTATQVATATSTGTATTTATPTTPPTATPTRVPPQITGLSIPAGSAAGGDIVTVSGANFVVGQTNFRFGTVPAVDIVCANTTSCTMKTPAHVAGTFPLIVLIGSSQTVLDNAFIFEPLITSISPTNSPMEGGQIVTITGAGFDNSATFLFASNPAQNVNCAALTSCTMVAPPLSFGETDNRLAGYRTLLGPAAPPKAIALVDVIVIINGRRFVFQGGFTYSSPPPLPISP